MNHLEGTERIKGNNRLMMKMKKRRRRK